MANAYTHDQQFNQPGADRQSGRFNNSDVALGFKKMEFPFTRQKDCITRSIEAIQRDHLRFDARNTAAHKVFDKIVHNNSFISYPYHTDNGAHCHNLSSRFSRVCCPKFEGDNFRKWLYEVEQFFEINEIPESTKVEVVSMNLEGRALQWHYSHMRSMARRFVSWGQYLREMISQFAHSEEPVAKLERLKQNGSVQAYQEQYEVILNEVILLETHAISLFLNGLNDEIKAAVRCCEPRTLIETMRFAKLHEKTVNAFNINQSMLPPLNSSLQKGNEVADMGNIVLNERLAYAKIELELKPKKDSKSRNVRNSYQGQVYCGDNTATTKVEGVIAHVVEGGANQDINLAVEASHKAFDEGLTPNKDEVLIENGDDFVYFQVVVESHSPKWTVK